MDSTNDHQQTATTALRIAMTADECKVIVLAQNLTFPMIHDPELPVLRYWLETLGATGKQDLPMNLGDEEEGESIQFSSREVLTAATRLNETVVRQDLMASGMMLGALRVGDMIADGGFRSLDSPLLEFARHFRNACAHGDRWHFSKNEPRSPARTRRIAISRELQGKRATWQTVDPRSYVEFLDEVRAHFMERALHEVIRMTFDAQAGQELRAVSAELMSNLSIVGIPVDNLNCNAYAKLIVNGELPLPVVLPYEYLPVEQQ